MNSFIHNVTFDCRKPRELASFWAAVLGYQLAEWSDDEGAAAEDPEGKRVRLLFIPVPEDKTVKNRLHLDIDPPDTLQAEVARLLKLGVRVKQEFDLKEGTWQVRWTIMQDPEGNEFCVGRGPNDPPTEH